jgi:hypothetical protein
MAEPVRVRVILANALLALVGSAASAAALHTLPPIQTEITFEDRRIERARRSCEVLFIGPSYVKAQIIERVFDAEAKRIGVPMRSCKFGGTGVRGIELQLHLTRLLRLDWPRLRFVVADITLGEDPRFERVNWFKARFIQWHTLDSAPWILDYYRRHPRAASATQLGAHAAHLAANHANLGAGIELFANLHVVKHAQRLVGVRVAIPVSPTQREYERDLRNMERRKKRQAHTRLTTAQLARHERRVATLTRQKRTARSRGKEREAVWPRELRASVEAHGVALLFVKAPVWRPLTGTASGSARPLVVMDFNDPERYPSLYTPRNRGRTHHVSWYGAIEYSKLLAREIAKHWKAARR